MFSISPGSGATPLPRNRMSPSAELIVPPGWSRRLPRRAAMTCSRGSASAANSKGSTTTQISQSRSPATPTLATPGVCNTRRRSVSASSNSSAWGRAPNKVRVMTGKRVRTRFSSGSSARSGKSSSRSNMVRASAMKSSTLEPPFSWMNSVENPSRLMELM